MTILQTLAAMLLLTLLGALHPLLYGVSMAELVPCVVFLAVVTVLVLLLNATKHFENSHRPESKWLEPFTPWS